MKAKYVGPWWKNACVLEAASDGREENSSKARRSPTPFRRCIQRLKKDGVFSKKAARPGIPDTSAARAGSAKNVSKIKASGADSVVTGNWGQDLTLLIKAAKDAGLDANFYTYYASNSGVPTALAAGLGGKVRMVGVGHNGLPGIAKWQAQFQQRFNDDWNIFPIYNALALLSEGIAKAKSTDPVKVAAAMSGLRFTGLSGEVEMRRIDHQLQQTLYIAEWGKATPQHPYSVDGTGFNFQELRVIPAYQASTPTSCQMKRP